MKVVALSGQYLMTERLSLCESIIIGIYWPSIDVSFSVLDILASINYYV